MSYISGKYGGKKAMLKNYVYIAKYMLGFYRNYKKINWNIVNRLIFVCSGNICRSAYADYKVKTIGISSDSFGLITKTGLDANSDAVRNAHLRGIDLSIHKTKRISDLEVGRNDLLIAMEPWQVKMLEKYKNEFQAQSTLLGIWNKTPRPFIHDPYSLSDDYFQSCFSLIDESVDELLRRYEKYQ